MTVAALLDEMGEGEFEFWKEFNLIEPIAMPWWQTGLTNATIANYSWHGGNKKITDFMPPLRKTKQPPNPDTLYKQAVAAVIGCGKRIVHANEQNAD